MSAIQRWYIWCEGEAPNTEEMPASDLALTPIDQQWCKAADVAQLEELIASQQKTHQAIVDGLRRQLWESDQAFRATQAENGKLRQAYAHLQNRIDKLMERHRG